MIFINPFDSVFVTGFIEFNDNFFRKINQLFSLDLGLRWDPAILDSQAELDFIKEAQIGLSDINNYWIGGYTKVRPGRIIQFCEYSPRVGKY